MQKRSHGGRRCAGALLALVHDFGVARFHAGSMTTEVVRLDSLVLRGFHELAKRGQETLACWHGETEPHFGACRAGF
jgi:hypothetical protein